MNFNRMAVIFGKTLHHEDFTKSFLSGKKL